MKKNGFTFIEILGVITLLALISTIVFVVVDKNLKEAKETLYQSQIENIRSSASMWMADNIAKIPEEGYYTILLKKLINTGYIDGGIKNPKTNELFDPNMIIRISMNDIKIGDETGFESADSVMLSVSMAEIDLLESKSNTLEDGIYYYDTNGNLELSGNIIEIDNVRNNPRGNILVSNHKVVNACLNYDGKNYEYSVNDGLSVRSFPCSTVRGENLIVNGDLSYGDNTNFSQFDYNDEGYLSVSGSSKKNLTNDEFIPIDINKKYEIGMTAKSNNQDAIYYLGFISYDVDKNIIKSESVMYIPNTLTTLARDLKKGDEYVYLTDMTNWNKTTDLYYQRGIIFWDYVDSTGYHYPELTYSRNYYNDIYEMKTDEYDPIEIGVLEDGEIVNRIKLKTTWKGNNIPVGTKLSQSNSGGSYNYTLLPRGNLNNNFVDYSELVFGVAQNGNVPVDLFRYGTKYIRIFSYHNYNELSDVTTSYKDFYIREVLD